MDISNYRLPEIELPTEQILDDDHNEILAALKVIENGYDRAQKRTRTILKAYNELQSVLINILKERRGGQVVASTSHCGEPLVDENILGTKTSTPKPQNCDIKNNNDSERRNDIEMIDLTSVLSYDRAKNRLGSTSPVISPELGHKSSRVKKSKSSKNESFGENCKPLVDEETEKITSKTSIIVSKRRNPTEIRTMSENEENRLPICENNANKNGGNDLLLNHHESRPLSKISLDKTIYNIEKHKTPSGKPSKQSTLNFQPVSTKVNIGGLKKIIAKSDVFGKCSGSLFDENYRTTKKTLCEANTVRSKERSKPTIVEDSTETKISVLPCAMSKSNSNAKIAKTSLIVPTFSQINETARSLFDDEDGDNFGVFDDLLNTCSGSPCLTDSSVMNKTDGNVARKRSVDTVESTSAIAKFHDSKSIDEIDETFFAPAELLKNSHVNKNITSDRPSTSSTVLKSTDKCENVRALKRKPTEESVVDTDKELGDLDLQDINWDAEISNDGWISPKRPNDSFHLPPEKAMKSTEYAHKGKVDRNKAKRSKLRGWNCWQCEKYYGNMDLAEDELRKRMDACSRHKSNYNPRYFTPEGFWDPEFPETAEPSICNENDSLQDRN